MEDYKVVLGLVSAALAIFGYFPYIWDSLKWKTTPHIYTWWLWGILTGVTFVIQLQNNGWAGSWVTWVTSFSCWVIVLIALKLWAQNITRSDTISLVLAFVALLAWYFLNNPLYSLILILIVETLAFYPTFRKSIKKPFEETISTYIIASFRSVLGIFALTQINLVNVLFPIYLVVVYGWFALMLIYLRSRKIW